MMPDAPIAEEVPSPCFVRLPHAGCCGNGSDFIRDNNGNPGGANDNMSTDGTCTREALGEPSRGHLTTRPADWQGGELEYSRKGGRNTGVPRRCASSNGARDEGPGL